MANKSSTLIYYLPLTVRSNIASKKDFWELFFQKYFISILLFPSLLNVFLFRHLVYDFLHCIRFLCASSCSSTDFQLNEGKISLFLILSLHCEKHSVWLIQWLALCPPWKSYFLVWYSCGVMVHHLGLCPLT